MSPCWNGECVFPHIDVRHETEAELYAPQRDRQYPKSAGEIPEEQASSMWHRVTCSLKETPLEGQTAGSIELCSILLLSKQPYI